MAVKEKSIWILLLFIFSGLVIGGLLGEVASNVNFLWWLGYSREFGLSTPLELDLSILKLTFGFMFKINISSILGLVVAIFLYKKIW